MIYFRHFSYFTLNKTKFYILKFYENPNKDAQESDPGSLSSFTNKFTKEFISIDKMKILPIKMLFYINGFVSALNHLHRGLCTHLRLTIPIIEHFYLKLFLLISFILVWII